MRTYPRAEIRDPYVLTTGSLEPARLDRPLAGRAWRRAAGGRAMDRRTVAELIWWRPLATHSTGIQSGRVLVQSTNWTFVASLSAL